MRLLCNLRDNLYLFNIPASIVMLCAGFFIALPQFANADQLRDSLRLKMKYLGQNQAVISKNIANANTPGYKALELQQPQYKNGAGAQSISLATTSPKHISQIGGSNGFKTKKQQDSYETAPNGNNVSIEEQMVKMSANNLEYQEVTNLLKKLSGMMNVARGER